MTSSREADFNMWPDTWLVCAFRVAVRLLCIINGVCVFVCGVCMCMYSLLHWLRSYSEYWSTLLQSVLTVYSHSSASHIHFEAVSCSPYLKIANFWLPIAIYLKHPVFIANNCCDWDTHKWLLLPGRWPLMLIVISEINMVDLKIKDRAALFFTVSSQRLSSKLSSFKIRIQYPTEIKPLGLKMGRLRPLVMNTLYEDAHFHMVVTSLTALL